MISDHIVQHLLIFTISNPIVLHLLISTISDQSHIVSDMSPTTEMPNSASQLLAQGAGKILGYIAPFVALYQGLYTTLGFHYTLCF